MTTSASTLRNDAQAAGITLRDIASSEDGCELSLEFAPCVSYEDFFNPNPSEIERQFFQKHSSIRVLGPTLKDLTIKVCDATVRYFLKSPHSKNPKPKDENDIPPHDFFKSSFLLRKIRQEKQDLKCEEIPVKTYLEQVMVKNLNDSIQKDDPDISNLFFVPDLKNETFRLDSHNLYSFNTFQSDSVKKVAQKVREAQQKLLERIKDEEFLRELEKLPSPKKISKVDDPLTNLQIQKPEKSSQESYLTTIVTILQLLQSSFEKLKKLSVSKLEEQYQMIDDPSLIDRKDLNEIFKKNLGLFIYVLKSESNKEPGKHVYKNIGLAKSEFESYPDSISCAFEFLDALLSSNSLTQATEKVFIDQLESLKKKLLDKVNDKLGEN